MLLDKDVNYIVSGLERSGTSMLMQIIHAGDIETSFDDSRKPDDNNPKGYFELEGGKIINRLMEKSFPFDEHKGKFIKITCYGLKFLPPGKYKIVYIERNIEEILDSMERMAKIKDENREETKTIFTKLNNVIKKQILKRSDCDVLFLNYNDILLNPQENIKKIVDFLSLSEKNLKEMVSIVDKSLYRERR